MFAAGDLLGFVPVRAWGSWTAMLPAFLAVGLGIGIALLGSVFTAGAHHTLAGRHVAAAGRVAHDVASARSADLLRTTPTDSRSLLANAFHDAAANGMAALLALPDSWEPPAPSPHS